MSGINTREIKGTDVISSSRNIINSNFINIKNWINNFIKIFGIDINNGIINLEDSTEGKISGKLASFNNINLPAKGTKKAQINSSGNAILVGITAEKLNVSVESKFEGEVNFLNNVLYDENINIEVDGQIELSNKIIYGKESNIINENILINSGLSPNADFPDNTGGGINTNINPYEITGTENIIYADCSGGLKLSVGDGTNEANIPRGFMLTIVNTSNSNGTIETGNQGSYYTGFNTNPSQGGWGIINIPSDKAYKSTMKLIWEPRIDQSSINERGSWVLLSSTNITI